MQLVGFQPIGDLVEIGRQGAFGNTELFGEIVGLDWFACGEQLAAKQLLPLAAVFAGGIAALFAQKLQQCAAPFGRLIQHKAGARFTDQVKTVAGQPLFGGRQFTQYGPAAEPKLFRDGGGGNRLAARKPR